MRRQQLLDFSTFAKTLVPPSEPTCCPDAYICVTERRAEIECPRHSGFTICCSDGNHIEQDRDVWHRQMDRWEQVLLDQHIQSFKNLQAVGLDDTLYGDRALRTSV
ncbi:hypothetical protein [Streptomyces sp. NPDC088727]|uniref:hypothetical protein n=1 Tax=Streptomyces sp. NPDC088727 TaxID=3365875 RepID=UPI0038076685